MTGLRFGYRSGSDIKWFTGPAGGEPPIGSAAPPPADPPRARIGGLGGSTQAQTSSILDLVIEPPAGFTVVAARWSDLQPVKDGALDASAVAAIAAGLTWAAGHGLPVLLRVDCLAAAPSWADPATWWGSLWLDGYRDMMAKLAASPGVGDHAALAAVPIMGVFAGNGWAANPVLATAAVAAGYTLDADLAALAHVIDTHATSWAPLNVTSSMRLAAHETVIDGAVETSTDRTIAVAEDAIAKLGSTAGFNLVGFAGANTTGVLQSWGAAHAPSVPLHVRSAPLATLTAAGATTATVVSAAATMGAASVEVAAGSLTEWTTTMAATAHAALRANLPAGG